MRFGRWAVAPLRAQICYRNVLVCLTAVISDRIQRDVFHKVESAETFTFNKEDHTLGNLLRIQLLRDPSVRFSGYKMPHPLFHKFELRVQTNGRQTPSAAVNDALKDLLFETQR